MIAVWMLYCVGIGLAFVIVGHALERGLHLAGRPARWAWVVALTGSYLIPVAAWVRPEAFSTFPVPVAPAITSPSAVTSTATTIFHQTTSAPFAISDLDTPLRWAWGIASLAILGALAAAATRLVSLRRRWRRANVDGRSVLVSSDVGPALIGVWSPTVVLPEWTLGLPASDRELMLAHEEEHLRASDPAVIAFGFLLAALAPWNLAIWWQWRRLRLAVEMDCDARVLAQGRSAATYGELLLAVSRRRSPRLIGAAPFGEPASFLESRIRRMLSDMPRWRWAGVAAALVVAIGALVGACETPRPLGPAQAPAEARGSSLAGQWLRPWVESNARRMFPAILKPSGPPMDVFVVADARLQVYRATFTTPHYLGDTGGRPDGNIGVAELKEALPSFAPGQDAWTVVDAKALRGIVRDNVRVIWIHHEPLPGEFAQEEQKVEGTAWWGTDRQAEELRRLAREYHPEVFGRVRSPVAVALVLDSQNRVLAHAAKTGEARGPDGLYYSREDCRQVLERLIPQYKNAQWSVSGCADYGHDRSVIVYWGVPLLPLTR